MGYFILFYNSLTVQIFYNPLRGKGGQLSKKKKRVLCWSIYIFCLWSFYEVTAHAQLKIARADSRKDKSKIKTCQYNETEGKATFSVPPHPHVN